MGKPKGKRGSWFATWEGESLPCVHKEWCVSRPGGTMHYRDPYLDDQPEWAPFIEAIRAKRKVILTSDLVRPEGGFTRTGYIAVYRVDDVQVVGRELHFDFVERLANCD